MIRDDYSILANSILNFTNVFDFQEKKEIQEFFIQKEDLLTKFLTYLEFWIPKKASKHSVIFLIKSFT